MDRLAFAGRVRELKTLERLLEEVRVTGTGRLVALRGRRQVGKSTLVERFCELAQQPHLFFAAARGQSMPAALADFSALLASADLPAASLAASGSFHTWPQALDAATSNTADPIILVLDEVPWLMESDRAFEGLLQRVWDRVLRRRPVLLILIGSDLAMMDAIGSYGHPLFDRATVLRVDPLTPADIADLRKLGAREALEAWALTGGFPNLLRQWPSRGGPPEFLRSQLDSADTTFVVSGERKLAAEFPSSASARPVLEAIGSGQRQHAGIGSRAGLAGSSLERALATLISRGAVEKDVAYSTSASKISLYRVADGHLRSWLRYVGSSLAALERGAAAPVVRSAVEDWKVWRGLAVEPIVRESVLRLALRDEELGSTGFVGGWWRRDHSIQVDLVLGDRHPVARSILALGSVKWRDRQRFERADEHELVMARHAVPGGESAPLVGVSGTGFAPGIALVRRWTPDDLVQAWRAS